MELSAEHEPEARAGADREEREVVDPSGNAGPALADRREIDVVVERHRNPEPLAQLDPERTMLEPRDVRRRQPKRLGCGLDDARDPEDNSVDAFQW